MSKYFIIADSGYPLKQPPCVPVPLSNEYYVAGYCEWRFLVFEKGRPMRVLAFRFQPGDKWDGASIPRPVWSLLGGPFHPDFMLASLIHDKCCQVPGLREIGDYIFDYLLEENGVGAFKRKIMFCSVRGYAITTKKK